MTCMESVSLAGQTIYCNGKHKDGSKVHSADYSRLPAGFFVGNIQQQLVDQGIAWVKWRKA